MVEILEDRRVCLITGANRGIGFETVRQLAQDSDKLVMLCSRNIKKGKAAARELGQVKGRVIPLQLDVTDQRSVDALAEKVKTDYGRLDILVNNAGILIDDQDVPSRTDLRKVSATLDTNVRGPWRMCKAFVPIMRKNRYGRIVNVSSGAGSYESLADTSYTPSYSLSKASLNALTVMWATELRETNILVNAVCPGWVRTDMGGPSAPRSVEQGADTIVWLATLPDGGPTGCNFRDRKQIEW